ncbi:MAG: A/G-specific adenine glycosylase [Ruminococcaceae bacterium]|nr:A/G-specific adenine glycosylase [Oscillospiraceae bacterium]
MKKEIENKRVSEVLTPHAVEALLAWYREHRRALPWRETRDPYRIWISEIMLQQTRVEAVKPYYARFLAAAPTPAALASLDEAALFKLWEGLGYYSRAKNLHRAAVAVTEQYGGEMPRTYEELRALAGVGDYTAGAIASIAYDVRVPAVDGNVLRVLSRLCASGADILDEKTKKRFREELLPVIPAAAGDFTQSLIELGATLCGPNTEAQCERCPLADVCEAHRTGLTGELPVRRAKKPRRVEARTVLLVRDGARTLLSKRPPKGLLAGLYELPNVEGHLDTDGVIAFVRALGAEPLRVRRIEDAKHIFSHIEWHMIAYDVTLSSDFDGLRGDGRYFLAENSAISEHYAIPSAFGAYTKYL